MKRATLLELRLDLGFAVAPLGRTLYGPAQAECIAGEFLVMDARVDGHQFVAESLRAWTSVPIRWGTPDGPHCGAVRKAQWFDLRFLDDVAGAVALAQLFPGSPAWEHACRVEALDVLVLRSRVTVTEAPVRRISDVSACWLELGRRPAPRPAS